MTSEYLNVRIILCSLLSISLVSVNSGQIVFAQNDTSDTPDSAQEQSTSENVSGANGSDASGNSTVDASPHDDTVESAGSNNQTSDNVESNSTSTLSLEQSKDATQYSTSITICTEQGNSDGSQWTNSTYLGNSTDTNSATSSDLSSNVQNFTFSDTEISEGNSTLSAGDPSNAQNQTLSINSGVTMNATMQVSTVSLANCTAQYQTTNSTLITEQNMSFNGIIPVNYTNASYVDVKFDSTDPEGNPVSGYYHIREADDSSTSSTGLTPAMFPIESEVPYIITAKDSDTHSFDHWADNGSTNKRRPVTAEQGDRLIRLKAVYVEVPPLPPDFTMSPGRESLVAEAGGVNATASLTLSSMREFNSAVGLNASTGVPGLAANLSVVSVDVFLERSGISMLTISAAPDILSGKYHVTIVATSGSLSHSKIIPVIVFKIPKT